MQQEDPLLIEPLFFEIKSPTPDYKECQKLIFIKEKSKNLSIFQKEKLPWKLHSFTLDEEFEPTLSLFESNKLNLPEEFNPDLIEALVKFFYFKEINPIPLNDVFQLLKLTFYLKIEQITAKILEFLKNSLIHIEFVSFIYKETLEFMYFFKEDGRKLIQPILEDCLAFLLENKKYEEFFGQFDSNFFSNMIEILEEQFYLFLKMMKNHKAPNDAILKFVHLFKEPLFAQFKKIDANFNTEIFLRKIFQENLVLTEINLKETEEVLKNLNIYENNQMKEFMVSVLSQKIAKLEEENVSLKAETEEAKINEKKLNQRINGLEEKIENQFKEFEEKMNQKLQECDEKINKYINDSNKEMMNSMQKNLELCLLEIKSIKEDNDKTHQKVEKISMSKNLFWENGSNTYCPLKNETGGSYYRIRNLERLNGPFQCKVEIVDINENLINAYWNYTFGLIRANSLKTNNYDEDSLIFHPKCQTATEFAGSGANPLFDKQWKVGDVLIVKRDVVGDIYFGVNDVNNLKKAFSNKNEEFNLVMGFSNSVIQGKFKIIEMS